MSASTRLSDGPRITSRTPTLGTRCDQVTLVDRAPRIVAREASEAPLRGHARGQAVLSCWDSTKHRLADAAARPARPPCRPAAVTSLRWLTSRRSLSSEQAGAPAGLDGAPCSPPRTSRTRTRAHAKVDPGQLRLASSSPGLPRARFRRTARVMITLSRYKEVDRLTVPVAVGASLRRPYPAT